jgi:uncharacterized membrane protein
MLGGWVRKVVKDSTNMIHKVKPQNESLSKTCSGVALESALRGNITSARVDK